MSVDSPPAPDEQMMATVRAAAALLVRRDAARRRGALALHARAAADACRLVDHLVRHYRPRRIYQWGSLLEPGLFNERSDIDLAVEGIVEAASYFRLLGELSELTDFPLDLVQLEKIDPVFACQIRRHGRLVYDHDRPA